MDRRRRGMLGNAVVPQVAEWIGRRMMESIS
jgi:site-specific DNA-cytosine methylase